MKLNVKASFLLDIPNEVAQEVVGNLLGKVVDVWDCIKFEHPEHKSIHIVREGEEARNFTEYQISNWLPVQSQIKLEPTPFQIPVVDPDDLMCIVQLLLLPEHLDMKYTEEEKAVLDKIVKNATNVANNTEYQKSLAEQWLNRQ